MTKLAEYLDGQPERKMREWAKDFGISRPYLFGLREGTRYPSVDVAERIAQATDGSVPISSWPNMKAVIAAYQREIEGNV